jgi:hypothetical protein
VRLRWDEIITRLSYRFNFLAIRGVSTFPVNGTNEINASRIIVDSDGKVWINEEQFFDGIDEAMKSFSVGGIQVVTQWLADRRGRILTTDDVVTYLAILSATSRLTDIPAEIDEVIEEKGGWPLP